MTKIANNILELIGSTPMVKINRLTQNSVAEVVAKLEFYNPGSSVKDRIADNMIADAEAKGLINQLSVIIEPTSGNTGVGLALVCAVKGYRLILTMPESMSIERRKLLKKFGAELVLTPAEKGMRGAIEKATELASENKNSFIPQQFQNPANPDIHRCTTFHEIWKDTEGRIDIFVSGVGTGGTITGVGEELKKMNPNIKIIAVEPSASPILSGGKPGPHKIQGIGAGFIPEVLNTKLIDEVFQVDNDVAIEYSHKAALQEGIMCGYSSGAALYAAVEISKRPENKGKRIVVILPDTGERYLSSYNID